MGWLFSWAVFQRYIGERDWARHFRVRFKHGIEARDLLVTFNGDFEALYCGKGLGWSLLSASLRHGIAARDWAGDF